MQPDRRPRLRHPPRSCRTMRPAERRRQNDRPSEDGPEQRERHLTRAGFHTAAP